VDIIKLKSSRRNISKQDPRGRGTQWAIVLQVKSEQFHLKIDISIESEFYLKGV